jgi:hypothetical protein
MIVVNVDELFTSWLSANLTGVGVASERPSDVQSRLPFLVVRRGGGGDLAQALDGPIMDFDYYAADWTTVGALARRVDGLLREQTPAGWRGAQFTMLRCNQAPMKVSDANTAVRHMAGTYSFSLQ